MADSQTAAQPTQTREGSTPNNTIHMTHPIPPQFILESQIPTDLLDHAGGQTRLIPGEPTIVHPGRINSIKPVNFDKDRPQYLVPEDKQSSEEDEQSSEEDEQSSEEDKIRIQAAWGDYYYLTDPEKYNIALHVLGYYPETTLLPVSKGESWSLVKDTSPPHPSAPPPPSAPQETSSGIVLTKWDPPAADQTITYGSTKLVFLKRSVVRISTSDCGTFVPDKSQLPRDDSGPHRRCFDLTMATVEPVNNLRKQEKILQQAKAEDDEGKRKVLQKEAAKYGNDLATQLARFLTGLESEDVKVECRIVKDRVSVRLTGYRGDKITAALAYALVIALKGGNHPFSTVIAHASATVQMEASIFIEGRWINALTAPRILLTVSHNLLHRPELVQGREVSLVDACANIAGALCRDMDPGRQDSNPHESLKATLHNILVKLETPQTLVRDSDESLRQISTAGLLCGMLVAGVLKYVFGLAKAVDDRKDDAKLALSVVMGAIGLCTAPFVGPVAGLAGVAGNALIDYLWGNPFKGLETAMRDFILTDIYWPLRRSKKVSWLRSEELSTQEVDRFISFFELALKSAHVL